MLVTGGFRQDQPLTSESGGWVEEAREDAGRDLSFAATAMI
ncbi:hypothetical protein [Mesorhizobium sp.]|nr:hypothetical protein [Mesorhizobium sp.]